LAYETVQNLDKQCTDLHRCAAQSRENAPMISFLYPMHVRCLYCTISGKRLPVFLKTFTVRELLAQTHSRFHNIDNIVNLAPTTSWPISASTFVPPVQGDDSFCEVLFLRVPHSPIFSVTLSRRSGLERCGRPALRTGKATKHTAG
jgi:hypothetical protein